MFLFTKQCIGKSPEKRITITAYKEEYDRAIARVKSSRGKAFKVKRSSTVEPVFGTLTEYMALRKVNTRGISNANKGMLIAAMAYNIKKYLKFTQKRVETVARNAEKSLLYFLELICLVLRPNSSFKF